MNPGKAKPPVNPGLPETASNPADLFKRNDVLLYSEKPVNYIESVRSNGFHLTSNIMISSPDKNKHTVGALLLQKEAYEVDFTDAYTLINGFIVEFDHEKILQIFEKVHPKPEILVVGLGSKSRVLSEKNRAFLASMGVLVEVGDSRNAAKAFDLLATERPNIISALLLPPNV